MRRREFLALLSSAAAWPLAARARQAAPALIGVLNGSSAAAAAQDLGAFRAAIQQLGYIEGRNILFEYRFADGNLDRLQELASELVRLNPRIIVSAPLPAHLAARTATTTIPIVMANGADPVGFGLVESLAHPGGNITGLANFAEVLASKQLDLMRELLPRLARVAVLINIANALHVPQWRETQDAATRASIALVPFEIQFAQQLEAAFAAFMREQAELLVLDEPTASLDAEAEHDLFLRLKALAADRSAILISHRFSTVRTADRIAVLQGGRIAELGSHDALLAKDGRYAHLFRLQASGYLS